MTTRFTGYYKPQQLGSKRVVPYVFVASALTDYVIDAASARAFNWHPIARRLIGCAVEYIDRQGYAVIDAITDEFLSALRAIVDVFAAEHPKSQWTKPLSPKHIDWRRVQREANRRLNNLRYKPPQPGTSVNKS
jgi:hypothetical protein